MSNLNARRPHCAQVLAAVVAAATTGCGDRVANLAGQGTSDGSGASPFEVAVGNNEFACAVRIGGSPWCWSRRGGAEPGMPQQLAGLADVRQIGIGSDGGPDQACALTGDGAVHCWGSANAPALVESIPPARVIAVGDGLDCALAFDGSVLCWGRTLCGAGSTCPVVIESGAVDLSRGADSHVCALLAGGRVACWGLNGSGELGAGTPSGPSSQAVPVPGVAGARALAVGEGHSAALLEDGRVLCWGDCGSGNAFTPVPVPNMYGTTDLGDGANFDNCVRTADGHVRCACLGVPGSAFTTLHPGSARCDFSFATVPNLDDIADVATSTASPQGLTGTAACAARGDGALFCWGPGAAPLLGVDAGTSDVVNPIRIPVTL